MSCSVILYTFYVDNTSKENELASEVFQVIDLAQKTNNYDIVIVGDSVARQIFPPEQQEESLDTCYLTSNQAITVLGNYLLLLEYLSNNPQTEEVIYIARPQSLANNLWLKHSYQYFIYPFYNDYNEKNIDEETKEIIRNKFGKVFVENEQLKDFIFKNSFFLSSYLGRIQRQEEIINEKMISELSVKYILKISQLCEERKIKFSVCSPPLSNIDDNRQWNEFEQQIDECELNDIMGDYVKRIVYYEVEDFSDKTHFTNEFLEKNREKIKLNLLN